MEFKNVTLIAKANIYFDGKVSSRTFFTAQGERKTLGIFLPGEYEFATAAEELMQILAGTVDVRLPGETEYRRYEADSQFTVAANSRFQLKVQTVTDYCCSYRE